MRILITGGAGFVGANLARLYRQRSASDEIVILDNLKRRGSESNLADFARLGITFVHGDIRQPADLADLPGQFDVFVEASAEPSVLAGLDGSPNYVLQTNLVGTLNCLEFARQRAGALIFLSTSRVYAIAPLKAIALDKAADRFEIAAQQQVTGVSRHGIAENFPTDGPRSLYGASKLASELILQEYCDTYRMRAVVNRCGVICGPGQFGKVDQGVFSLWVVHHFFKKALQYTGFGGTGHQVRDLLHPADLFDLIDKQLADIERVSGSIYNVGGGPANSVSLKQMTALCRELTGNEVPIQPRLDTSAVDIPLYVSDNRRVEEAFGWKPKRGLKAIANDVLQWLRSKEELARVFGAAA